MTKLIFIPRYSTHSFQQVASTLSGPVSFILTGICGSGARRAVQSALLLTCFDPLLFPCLGHRPPLLETLDKFTVTIVILEQIYRFTDLEK